MVAGYSVAASRTPAQTTTPQISAILATIKQLESGDYAHPPNAGGASGAYQYIQSTWTAQANAAGYGSYANEPAYLAPPAVQDAVAAHNVQDILAGTGGNVADVPLAWYYPASIANPGLLDIVPYPGAGNVLTPRQYQTRWLATYNSIAASGNAPTITLPGGGSMNLGGNQTSTAVLTGSGPLGLPDWVPHINIPGIGNVPLPIIPGIPGLGPGGPSGILGPTVPGTGGGIKAQLPGPGQAVKSAGKIIVGGLMIYVGFQLLRSSVGELAQRQQQALAGGPGATYPLAASRGGQRRDAPQPRGGDAERTQATRRTVRANPAPPFEEPLADREPKAPSGTAQLAAARARAAGQRGRQLG